MFLLKGGKGAAAISGTQAVKLLEVSALHIIHAVEQHLPPFVVSVIGESLVKIIKDGGIIQDVTFKDYSSNSALQAIASRADREREPLYLTYFNHEDDRFENLWCASRADRTHTFRAKSLLVLNGDLPLVVSCASLALADAGIMMYDLVTAVSLESNKRAEPDLAAHAKELEESKKQMETKLEDKLREMKEFKRMVQEMMVNQTPNMSCNPFTGSETQPPSQP